MVYYKAMNTIYFATANHEKIRMAQTLLKNSEIDLRPVELDIDEIQGEDPELIVRDKAQRAYDKLQMPVIVSDDTWHIKALNGFPGAYMKSINYWFTPDDFLRLMHGIEDRTILLRQYLAYTDGNITEIFKHDITGKIVNKPRGHNQKVPCATVIEIEGDNGKTIAEVFEQGESAVTERYKKRRDVWNEFIDWYNTKD